MYKNMLYDEIIIQKLKGWDDLVKGVGNVISALGAKPALKFAHLPHEKYAKNCM